MGPRWEYVDARRRHGVRAIASAEAVVIEELDLVSGGRRRERHPVKDGWEARYHIAELEGRLAAADAYWRSIAGGPWGMLPRHPGVASVDLSAVPVGHVGLHALHAPTRERLLIDARAQGQGRMVAALDYPAEEPEAAILQLIHPSVPEACVRSLLAREHLAAARAGFEKLADARALALVHGANWRADLARRLGAALAKLDASPPPVPEAPSAWGPSECAAALAWPRLRALEDRFLGPDTRTRLTRAGRPAIRREVARLRERTPHREQHLVSLLEACLVIRHCLAASEWDPDAAALLRHAECTA